MQQDIVQDKPNLGWGQIIAQGLVGAGQGMLNRGGLPGGANGFAQAILNGVNTNRTLQQQRLYRQAVANSAANAYNRGFSGQDLTPQDFQYLTPEQINSALTSTDKVRQDRNATGLTNRVIPGLDYAGTMNSADAASLRKDTLENNQSWANLGKVPGATAYGVALSGDPPGTPTPEAPLPAPVPTQAAQPTQTANPSWLTPGVQKVMDTPLTSGKTVKVNNTGIVKLPPKKTSGQQMVYQAPQQAGTPAPAQATDNQAAAKSDLVLATELLARRPQAVRDSMASGQFMNPYDPRFTAPDLEKILKPAELVNKGIDKTQDQSLDAQKIAVDQQRATDYGRQVDVLANYYGGQNTNAAQKNVIDANKLSAAQLALQLINSTSDPAIRNSRIDAYLRNALGLSDTDLDGTPDLYDKTPTGEPQQVSKIAPAQAPAPQGRDWLGNLMESLGFGQVQTPKPKGL
jgi:hypothetical protein